MTDYRIVFIVHSAGGEPKSASGHMNVGFQYSEDGVVWRRDGMEIGANQIEAGGGLLVRGRGNTREGIYNYEEWSYDGIDRVERYVPVTEGQYRVAWARW